VFPYYVVELHFEPELLNGVATLKNEIAYLGTGEEESEQLASVDVDLKTQTILTPEETDVVMFAESEPGAMLRILLDNSDGGWHFYEEGLSEKALTLNMIMEITDDLNPPYDWQFDIAIRPYCEKPDLRAPGPQSTNNETCPLAKPDFPEPEEEITDGDEEMEESDMEPDGDDVTPPAEGSGSSGCGHTSIPNGLWLALLMVGLMGLRRSRTTFRFQRFVLYK